MSFLELCQEFWLNTTIPPPIRACSLARGITGRRYHASLSRCATRVATARYSVVKEIIFQSQRRVFVSGRFAVLVPSKHFGLKGLYACETLIPKPAVD